MPLDNHGASFSAESAPQETTSDDEAQHPDAADPRRTDQGA
jgi:hypothetical protein